jgi:pre-mRNA-processing factor SLU7
MSSHDATHGGIPVPISSQKDSFQKRKDEAKKKQSGELPPDLDQDGKMINPHNPDFITKVPWYLGSSGPTLKHHTVQKSNHFLSMTETDQLIAQKQQRSAQTAKALQYRKGACKNCGAMTHNEKACVERPRSTKKQAWKSGLDLAEDEVELRLEQHGNLSYDGKRDQWSGYNPEEYEAVIGKYERIEAERRKKKLELKEQRRLESEEAARKKKEDRLKARQQKRLTAETEGEPGSGGQDKAEDAEDSFSDMDSDSGSDLGSDDESQEGEVSRVASMKSLLNNAMSIGRCSGFH